MTRAGYQTGAAEAILVIGQSVAEGGCDGVPEPLTDTPAYPENALMLTGGPVGRANQRNGLPLVPLCEDLWVTIAHSLTRHLVAHELRARDHADYRLVLSGQAWGGKSYLELKRGGVTRNFELLVEQVATIAAQCKGIVYRGIVCIHGEQDGLGNNLAYENDLAQWRSDLAEEIRAITRQAGDIDLFTCQTSSAAGYGRCAGIRDDRFQTPLQQLKAHEEDPRIHLVTPKYHLRYHDHSHLTNAATRLLGEYYARAFRAVRETGTWSPLRPVSVRANGDAVVVEFAGNDGPIVFDTDRVPEVAHYGFSYADDESPSRRIVSVSIAGPARVRVQLNGTVGRHAVLAYAYHNGEAGPTAQVAGRGDRGNLRDSSAAVSNYDGNQNQLYGWLVAFRKAVTKE